MIIRKNEVRYGSTESKPTERDINGVDQPYNFEIPNTAISKPKQEYSVLDAMTTVLEGGSPIGQFVYDVLDDNTEKAKQQVNYDQLNKGFNKSDYFMQSGASLKEAETYFEDVHSYADAQAWSAKRAFVNKSKNVVENSGYSGVVADLISSTIGDPVFVASTVVPGAVISARAKLAARSANIAAEKNTIGAIALGNFDRAIDQTLMTSRMPMVSLAPKNNISILKTTGEALLGGAAFQGVDEIMRRELDPTRTQEDSTNAIITTTLFAGILGGAFGTYQHLKSTSSLKRVSSEKPDTKVFDDMADDSAGAARAGFTEKLTADDIKLQGNSYLAPFTKATAGLLGPRNRGVYFQDVDMVKDYADIYGQPTVRLNLTTEGKAFREGLAEIHHTVSNSHLPTTYTTEQSIRELMKVKNIDRQAAETEFYILAQGTKDLDDVTIQRLKQENPQSAGVIDAIIAQKKLMKSTREEADQLGFGEEYGNIEGYSFPLLTNKDKGIADQVGLHQALKDASQKRMVEIQNKLQGGVNSLENLMKATEAEREFQIMQFANQRGVNLDDIVEGSTGFGGANEKVLHQPKFAGEKPDVKVKAGGKDYTVKFDSDFDYALYNLNSKDKQSEFFKFARNNSELTDQEIISAAKQVKDRVKELSKAGIKADTIGVKRVYDNQVSLQSPALEGMERAPKKARTLPAETGNRRIDNANKLFKDDAEYQAMMDDLMEQTRQLRVAIDDVEESAKAWADQALTRWTSGLPGYADFVGFGRMRDKPGFWNRRLLNPVDFAKWAETNPQILNSYYFNQHGLAVGLKKKFGTHKTDVAFKAIREKYDVRAAKMRNAGDYEGATKLLDNVGRMEKDFTAAVEQMQGTYAKDFYQKYGAAASTIAAAKVMTGLAKLGNVVMGSLPELPAIFMTHNMMEVMPTIKDAVKFLSTREGWKMGTKDLQGTGRAFELTLNDMQYAALTSGGGIGEALVKGENYLGFARKWGQRLNGQVFYDSFIRSVAGLTQQTMLIRNLRKMASGKLSNKDLENLAYLGIGKHEASSFLKELEPILHEESGLVFLNLDKIANKEIGYRVKVALDRDLRRTYLVSRTGDLPHIMMHPAMSLVMQFKSWPILATQNYMLPMLQKADAKTLSTFAMMSGVGVMVTLAKESMAGRDISNVDPIAALYSGVDTAIGGIFSEVLNPVAGHIMKMNGVEPLGGSKFYDKRTALEGFMGPAAGMLNDVFRGGYYGVQALEAKAGFDVNDTSSQAAQSIMRVMPMNNFPILGNAFKEYLAPAGK